jgi:tRNA (cmo5U34)-methyltransferase
MGEFARLTINERDDLETASAPESGRWTFDADVTASFEDMLARSIPNYGGMREVVTRAADWLMDMSTFRGARYPGALDLGASRGSALAPLVDRWGARARFHAVEVSGPMVGVLRERFEGMIDAGIMTVSDRDLREGLPALNRPPAVTLLVLTLQFLPIEYRQKLLREVYEQTAVGGGLILVEKVLGTGHEANSLLTDLYYGLKRENGYTQDAIDRKRLSLEGVLVPVTADMNETFLRSAGFDLVELIWAWCNFRAWVAVKR